MCSCEYGNEFLEAITVRNFLLLQELTVLYYKCQFCVLGKHEYALCVLTVDGRAGGIRTAARHGGA